MEVPSRYEVRREIGRGGMGVVYEAYDTRLRRLVALKVLPNAESDPERRARFAQEARAASALNHPNIVTIHDIEGSGSDDCIVMEYLDGEPLTARIAAGPMPVLVAVAYAAQVADALAAAHQAGIVHRDLKPGNIMVTRNGRVKVVDFGLSKLLHHQPSGEAQTATYVPQTETGIVSGTAGYMSPEQASGDPVDARSDVFSLGVVLYEMLAGRRAFGGDSYWSTLRAVLQSDPEPISRMRSEVPQALQHVVSKCLEKDPARRYASGVELTAALAPITAPPVSQWRVPGRTAAGAAAVLALIAAVPLYQAYQSRVRAAALDQLEHEIDEGRYATAYVRARDLERQVPSHPDVQRAIQKLSSPWNVSTDPPGATIHFKDYGDRDAPWHLLGVTPIEGVRPPGGALHWRLTKDGFEPVEGRFWWGLQSIIRLHPAGTRPKGMVYAPGGIVPAIAGLALPPIPEFWIDKFEVTNAEFKAFVDAGGYRDRRWWKHEANRDGRPLAWVDAMRLFVDRTGRPGPATWEAGTYPAGRAEYPVTGVSWFEAAAFAEFSGKSLPTVYQFQYAGGPPNLRHDVRQGNFGSGPAAVSALRDLGPLGTYGLAGNVKEWVWNGVGDSASSPAEQHYIMGGGWNEPPYMGTAPDARPALDRADTNGIRLVRHIASPDAAGLANLRVLEEHTPPPIAVGDEAFDAYRRFYVYEQSPLDAKTESVSDTGDWTNEQVSIAAAYGNERIPITLLLPKNALPPYQTVIWCPGAYSLSLPESERMVMAYYFDFVVKSGRAVVMPDFQGFYSRRSETPAQARQPQREAFRDRVVQSAKDLNRTMDYLATRSDIDAAAVVYYVFSVGGATLAVPAMAPRLKGIIFLSAGLPRQPFPPEIDPVNFAPRLKTPVLFLGGRYDYLTPVESAQKALFDRLGTPEASKKHVIFESGHVPERIAVIREVLDWLDRTLGPVKTN